MPDVDHFLTLPLCHYSVVTATIASSLVIVCLAARWLNNYTVLTPELESQGKKHVQLLSKSHRLRSIYIHFKLREMMFYVFGSFLRNNWSTSAATLLTLSPLSSLLPLSSLSTLFDRQEAQTLASRVGPAVQTFGEQEWGQWDEEKELKWQRKREQDWKGKEERTKERERKKKEKEEIDKDVKRSKRKGRKRERGKEERKEEKERVKQLGSMKASVTRENFSRKRPGLN